MKNLRLLFTVVCLLILEASLIGRVGWLQIFKSEEYKEIVVGQSSCKKRFRPSRGRIYDRNLELLAASIITKSLYTFPSKLDNPSLTARQLGQKGIGTYEDNMRKFDTHPDFTWVKRHVSDVRDLGIRDIFISKDVKRVYPAGLASSIVGKTDDYGKGISGIEYKYDEILEGESCIVTMGRTPTGRLYPRPGGVLKEAKSGCDIILTIDAVVQAVIEDELRQGVAGFDARGGMAIVLNPITGEILGMASLSNSGNTTIATQYEPGSTFKIVTLSCVIEDNIASFDSIVEDGTGMCLVENKVIKDEKEHGPFTLREAVARSSNVAFVNLASALGSKRLYEMAVLFGFGQKTGIDLQGEVSGNIHPPSGWSPLRLANVAFGQGISCNFLQLSMAYACIANNGILMRPYVVKEIVDRDGGVLYTGKSKVVRRVIDDSTAREVVELLKGVVSDEGTGVLAQIEGLDIAGKTGTAQKFKDGSYTEEYISSFIGFFPAEKPSLLVGILIDEPKDVHFGSLVAAPIFKKIVTRLIYTEMIATN